MTIHVKVNLLECLSEGLFLFFVRRGSVIGMFLVEYQHLDGYQIVDFVDQVTEDMQVGEMYIGKFDVINLSGKSQIRVRKTAPWKIACQKIALQRSTCRKIAPWLIGFVIICNLQFFFCLGALWKNWILILLMILLIDFVLIP